MKLKRSLSLLLCIVLAMAMLTGCSSEQNMTLAENGSGTYVQTVTMTAEEWSSLGLDEMLQLFGTETLAESGLEITDTADGGKQMLQTIQFKSAADFNEQLAGLVSVAFNKNYFTMNTTYLSTDGADELTDTMDMLPADELENILKILQNTTATMKVTFPYDVVDTNGTKQEDGKTVVWDNDQSKEDRFYATFTDAQGTKAPEFTGAETGKSYNSAVTLGISSEVLLESVTVNGEETVSDLLALTDEGSYTVTATDISGNSATVKFCIDMTKPVVKGVANGKTYKSARTIKFSDSGSGIKKATLNGKTVKSGRKVSKKGTYTLKVTDQAGNSKTVKFSISK